MESQHKVESRVAAQSKALMVAGLHRPPCLFVVLEFLQSEKYNPTHGELGSASLAVVRFGLVFVDTVGARC